MTTDNASLSSKKIEASGLKGGKQTQEQLFERLQAKTGMNCNHSLSSQEEDQALENTVKQKTNSLKRNAPEFSIGKEKQWHDNPLSKKVTKFDTPGVGLYANESEQYIQQNLHNSPQTKFNKYKREMFESGEYAKTGTLCPVIQPGKHDPDQVHAM